MASHPYISGAGHITQIITLLRKNFPATVNADTIKKYGLAPNNESYVINTLQFIGFIDSDNKRTERGHEICSIHDQEAFQKAFGDVIREAYSDLFETRGEDAWSLSRSQLIGYFRANDKTSEVVGGRQAGVFRALAALAGHGELQAAPNSRGVKPKTARSADKVRPKTKLTPEKSHKIFENGEATKSRDMVLTVRIEINLPTEGSRETYDNIFKSIRANLLDE